VLWPWQGMLPAAAPSCLRSPNHHTARRFYHGSAAGIVAHHAPLTNPNRCPGSSRKPALPMAGGGGQLPWTGAGSGPFGNTHARFLFGGGVKSPYDVLEISSVATTKEIKFAYLDMARRYHPDANPDDPYAKVKFQEVSEAYQTLSDPTRRRNYDADPGSWGGGTGGGAASSGHPQDNAPYTDAEKQFLQVLEEIDVMREVVNKYVVELTEDVNYTKDQVTRGETGALLDFAERRKALAGAILFPVLIVFRMPWIVTAAITIIPRAMLSLLRWYELLPPNLKAYIVMWVQRMWGQFQVDRDSRQQHNADADAESNRADSADSADARGNGSGRASDSDSVGSTGESKAEQRNRKRSGRPAPPRKR